MTDHEVLRDLREVGSDGPPRVRGPVRDRVSAQPEPDPGAAGKPARRAFLWRLVATAIIVGILVLIGLTTGGSASDPSRCDELRRQSEWTSDVAVEMEENGCLP